MGTQTQCIKFSGFCFALYPRQLLHFGAAIKKQTNRKMDVGQLRCSTKNSDKKPNPSEILEQIIPPPCKALSTKREGEVCGSCNLKKLRDKPLQATFRKQLKIVQLFTVIFNYKNLSFDIKFTGVCTRNKKLQ